MTPDAWLQAATVDAECRGLSDVVPLLANLAPSLTALRAASWQDRADAGDVATSAVTFWKRPAVVSRRHGATPLPAKVAHASIADLARTIRDGRLSSRALVDEAFDRVRQSSGLNAFVSVFEERARRDADRCDAELRAGHDRGWLHGLPVSLKDLIDMEGVATTAASAVRRDHRAVSDAACVTALRTAGAVLIGKTNLHEFAFGTTNEDSAFGPARHPLDPSRWPGGSSGGSAAAVAAGIGVASIGTDTGGSIRIPAAICGIVGLKPTFGEVPTDGVVPLGMSLDHVGPLARSVDDSALVAFRCVVAAGSER